MTAKNYASDRVYEGIRQIDGELGLALNRMAQRVADQIVWRLDGLSPDWRLAVFKRYCQRCGSNVVPCQCAPPVEG